METRCFFENKIYVQKLLEEKEVLREIQDLEGLTNFFKAALAFQKENLFWFTLAIWFNNHSEKIFDMFLHIHHNQMRKNPEKWEKDPFIFENEMTEARSKESSNKKNSSIVCSQLSYMEPISEREEENINEENEVFF